MMSNTLTKKKNMNRKQRRTLFAWCSLAPVLILFTIFFLIPIALCFYYSLTNKHMAYNTYDFIGLENYITLFTKDHLFRATLANTIKILFYTVPFILIFSTGIAVMINGLSKKLQEVFTFVYFLPTITSMVAVSVVWKWLFDPAFSPINMVLNKLGLQSLLFINSTSQALPSLGVIEIWKSSGYFAVIILAAIKNISESYYEAGELEGANKFQLFRYITLPLIKNSLVFTTMVSTINAFGMFITSKVMTDGGPGNSTKTLVFYIYNKGIENREFGYATTGAVTLLILVMIISFFQWKLTEKDNTI